MSLPIRYMGRWAMTPPVTSAKPTQKAAALPNVTPANPLGLSRLPSTIEDLSCVDPAAARTAAGVPRYPEKLTSGATAGEQADERSDRVEAAVARGDDGDRRRSVVARRRLV